MKKIVLSLVCVILATALCSCGLTSLNLGKKTTDTTAVTSADTTADTSADTLPEGIKSTITAKCGEIELTSDLIDYAVYALYNNIMYYYGSYASMLGIDETLALDKQNPSDMASLYLGFDSSVTWYENLADSAKDNYDEMLTLAAYAKSKGITETDEDKAENEELKGEIAEAAEEDGVTSDEYLAEYYTSAVTVDTVMKYAEIYHLATRGYDDIVADYEITDGDAFVYMENNKSSYFTLDIKYFLCESGDDNKALAEKIIAADSLEAGAEEYLETYTTENTVQTVIGTSVDELYFDAETFESWVFDESRKSGDRIAVKSSSDENMYYAVELVTVPSLATTKTVDVAHILVDDEETANKVLQLYLDGGDFSALALEYSTDTGSNTEGGLYEDVTEGEMVTEFNDWCFDESRKEGDTGIVKTDYGYHVMLFVGTGIYEISQAKETIESQMYAKDYNTIAETFPVEWKE